MQLVNMCKCSNGNNYRARFLYNLYYKNFSATHYKIVKKIIYMYYLSKT